jgi:hypothetical protein
MRNTLISGWQPSNWHAVITGGFAAIEGSREAQFIDYTDTEESYELLPSGD